MKIAVVMLPRTGKCELLVCGQPNSAPRALTFRRGRISLGTLAVLACAVAVGVGTYWSFKLGIVGRTDASQRKNANAAAEFVERRTIVRPLDESQELKKGDLVVLRPNSFSTPKIQQVAARPNETVVIRRDGAIDSLYMVGGSGYVVVSDTEHTRIVRPEQITGTVVSGSIKD